VLVIFDSIWRGKLFLMDLEEFIAGGRDRVVLIADIG
jgi:hypothetical protein